MTIFGLKMMMKSGLDFFILKYNKPLQSCCCTVQKIWPCRLAGISEGVFSITKQKFLHHLFSPSFLCQKWLFQELRVYKMSSSYCDYLGTIYRSKVSSFFLFNDF